MAKYEGIVDRVEGTKILVLSLKFKDKNKILADHVWIDKPVTSGTLVKDDVIVFSAVATSYISTKKVRKYGLIRINTLNIDTDILNSTKKIVDHDDKHTRKRKYNMYKERR